MAGGGEQRARQRRAATKREHDGAVGGVETAAENGGGFLRLVADGELGDHVVRMDLVERLLRAMRHEDDADQDTDHAEASACTGSDYCVEGGGVHVEASLKAGRCVGMGAIIIN